MVSSEQYLLYFLVTDNKSGRSEVGHFILFASFFQGGKHVDAAALNATAPAEIDKGETHSVMCLFQVADGERFQRLELWKDSQSIAYIGISYLAVSWGPDAPESLKRRAHLTGSRSSGYLDFKTRDATCDGGVLYKCRLAVLVEDTGRLAEDEKSVEVKVDGCAKEENAVVIPVVVVFVFLLLVFTTVAVICGRRRRRLRQQRHMPTTTDTDLHSPGNGFNNRSTARGNADTVEESTSNVQLQLITFNPTSQDRDRPGVELVRSERADGQRIGEKQNQSASPNDNSDRHSRTRLTTVAAVGQRIQENQTQAASPNDNSDPLGHSPNPAVEQSPEQQGPDHGPEEQGPEPFGHSYENTYDRLDSRKPDTNVYTALRENRVDRAPLARNEADDTLAPNTDEGVTSADYDQLNVQEEEDDRYTALTTTFTLPDYANVTQASDEHGQQTVNENDSLQHAGEDDASD
ncbi:hypothetical protein BaRGS_00039147 [Batillaria attramentaria]|uniref:Uncharacterized protein n=1 Tax=Batillaria attramentaria TaxID=370345 RepID=A0ABD0J459_9CAEN